MTNSTLNSQPRFETDIFATLYIAVENAMQATADVRDVIETEYRGIDRCKQIEEMREHDAQLEAQANAARSERISVR